MPVCSNCGAAFDENVRFCPKCGREVGAVPSTTPSPTGANTSTGGLADNVVGLLCCVLGFITGILFLVLEPFNRNPFVRFHALQSIFFSIACVVLSVVVGMIPFIGLLLSPVLGLAFLAGWVFLMVQAYQNKKWKLPIIGTWPKSRAEIQGRDFHDAQTWFSVPSTRGK